MPALAGLDKLPFRIQLISYCSLLVQLQAILIVQMVVILKYKGVHLMSSFIGQIKPLLGYFNHFSKSQRSYSHIFFEETTKIRCI